MNVRAEVAAFRRGFAQAGDPDRAAFEKGYHKSALRFHGVDAKTIRTAAAAFKRAHRNLSRDQLLALVAALWDTTWFDLRSVGLELLQRHHRLLVPADIDLLEDLLRRSRGWAHVDWLSTGIIGPLVERAPELLDRLDAWSKDDDFWVRRASMLALLMPLRRGAGDFERFARYASPMLEEREFFIRKAIGWILREVSKKRPELAQAFLAANIDRVSGLTLREGSKYLPAPQRERLLARYQARKTSAGRKGSKGSKHR